MIKNYFFQYRKITQTALIQRGTITWTIDSNDLPTNESMGIFCDSLIEGKRVSWEVESGSLLSRGMVRVTFRVDAWEKPDRPLMLALRPENRSPQP